MICPKCKYENVEEAKYCVECGAKLVQEETESASVEEPVVENTAEEELKQWHYVKGEETVGPVSEKTILQLMESHEIGENTYVWKEGMSDWILLRDSEFLQGLKEWYYAKGQDSIGPFTRSEMIELLHGNTLNGNTYVWKKGMEDWAALKDSDLIDRQAPASAPLQNSIYHSRKNIVLQVVLSIATCGIFQLCWLYTIAEDINTLNRNQNKPEPFEPVLVVILSIITCGLYGIYFFWKAGKSVAHLQFENFQTEDDSTLLTIVAVFASIVSCAIMQNSLNELADYVQTQK